MLGLLFLAFILLRVLYWFLVETAHPKGFPPGPRFSFPLVGDIFAISQKDPFQKMRKKYGSVFGFWLGHTRTVVVSGYELFQEIGFHDKCQDRIIVENCPPVRGEYLLDGTLPGLTSGEGKSWKELRRFSLHTLRNLGFGKAAMETIVQEELEELLRELDMYEDKPVDVKPMMRLSVLNVLWKVTTSERLKQSDPKLISLNAKLDKMFLEVLDPVKRMFFEYPFLRLVNKVIKYSLMKEVFDDLHMFVNPAIDEHKRTFQTDSIRDYIDAFIKRQEEDLTRKDYSPFTGHDGLSNFPSVIIDIFMAGKDTTSTTMYWLMLLMLHHPEIQCKVQAELDRVTERARLPAHSDKEKTPYTNAVILEAQRFGMIVPISVPHSNNGHDITICDGKYTLPRGTNVILDMETVMFNPEQFPEPNKFKPSRYINANGEFEPHPHVIPFGLGKRRCIGEIVAKHTMYVFFSGILSKYTILPEHETKLPSINPISSFIRSPRPFKLRLKTRD